MSRVLTLDVGKTGCRAALWVDGERVRSAESPGPSGLADAGGAEQAVSCMRRSVADLSVTDVDTVVAGLAGLLSARHAVPILVEGLSDTWPTARVLVTTDAMTSHAGALSGRPGVVLAAGTGSTAVAVSAGAELTLVDGWGYLLGDAGSGYAIGRAGLGAALRHADGRGGSAPLHAHAEQRYGTDLRSVPAAIHGAANPAREIASFATAVFAAARAGDPTALEICADAGRELATTIAAAAQRSGQTEDPQVTTIGGLLGAGAVLCEPLDEHLDRLLPGCVRRAPDGDAHAGAHLLATDPSLPHHRVPDAITTKEPR